MQRLFFLFPQPAWAKVNRWSSRLKKCHLCLLSSSCLTLWSFYYLYLEGQFTVAALLLSKSNHLALIVIQHIRLSVILPTLQAELSSFALSWFWGEREDLNSELRDSIQHLVVSLYSDSKRKFYFEESTVLQRFFKLSIGDGPQCVHCCVQDEVKAGPLLALCVF